MTVETIRLDQKQLADIEAATKDLRFAGVAMKALGDAAKASVAAVREALRNRDQLLRDLGIERDGDVDRRLDQIEGALAGGVNGAELGARIGSFGGPAGRLAGTITGAVAGTVGGVVVGSEQARFKRELAERATAFDDALFGAAGRLRVIVLQRAQAEREAAARREAAVARSRKVR